VHFGGLNLISVRICFLVLPKALLSLLAFNFSCVWLLEKMQV
jgi:hypothetical protein